MLNRTRAEKVVFRHPFHLKGWTEPQAAGAYTVETEEEMLEALSFPAWRRVSTTLTRQANRPGATVQAIPVDPQELAALLAKDIG